MYKYLILILAAMPLFAQPESHASGPCEELSQKFLYALRIEENEQAEEHLKALQALDVKEVAQELKTDAQRKAFWINCYNAFIMYQLRKDSSLYEDRGKFFKSKSIELLGLKLSFDDIEHGILRRSRYKYSLGYWSRWFVPKHERLFRVKKIDHRIHFALNCGAAGCPPIAFYGSKKLEEQLELAEEGFLTGTSKVDEQRKVVEISPLMNWFRGDFGGNKGVKKLLLKYDIIKDKDYSIEYFEYDWTLTVY